jgi:hypothetical protein
MKKAGNKSNAAMISLLIKGIMLISVLSYAFLNVFDSGNKKGVAQITGFVMKENLSSEARQQYLQQGMTFLELHYDYLTDLASIEDFPNQFMTPFNEIQLIIIEIQDTDRQFAVVQSLNGEEEINSTDINDIAKSLCNMLMYPPVECMLDKMNANQTSSSNATLEMETTTTTILEGLSAATLPSNGS